MSLNEKRLSEQLADNATFKAMADLIAKVDRMERRAELFEDIFADLFKAWETTGEVSTVDDIQRVFTRAVIDKNLFERIVEADQIVNRDRED